MSRTLEKFLIGLFAFAVFVCIVIGLFFYLIYKSYNIKLRETYGHEAVSALALDAATVFPLSNREFTDSGHWARHENPCIFTTNVVQQSGNTGLVSWENWPSGEIPGCRDFYSSRTREYNQSTTIPTNCIPVFTFYNSGGSDNSFVVLAAEGADTSSLDASYLTPEKQEKIEKLGRPPFYYYTSDFVKAGGLDKVSVELTEKVACDGFTLFRYHTEIDDLKKLEETMRAHNYFVGMK